MDIRNQRALKDTAAARLSGAAYDPKKIALLHTGAALAVTFLITLINYLLSQQIENTSGLSGLGSRAILSTIQSTLQYASSIALPFWELGFVYAAISMARGQAARPSDLPEGFRRFGPALRLMLLEGVLFLGLAMILLNISSLIYSVTPFAQTLTQQLIGMMSDTSMTVEALEETVAQMPITELMDMIMPMLVIFGILYAVIAIPLAYRFRMANFVIMDQPKTGAFAALRESSRMMRRNRLQLFRLDLSFWWYYGLLLLTAVLSYGDVILSYLGVTLPISADVAWFAFYILGALAQLVLYWQTQSYVQTTYAVAYDILRQQVPVTPPVKQPPKALPWDDYNTQP